MVTVLLVVAAVQDCAIYITRPSIDDRKLCRVHRLLL